MHKVIVRCSSSWDSTVHYLKLTECQKKLLDYLITNEVISEDDWDINFIDETAWEEV